MYRNTKKILVFSFLIMSFIGFGFYNVDAQVEQKFSPIADSVSCIDAQYDLSFGSRDYALYGNVQKLQHFLFENGIMYHAPTGYFGPITQASLIKYQTLRNLYPTGFFDSNTRKAVARETCEQNEIVNNVRLITNYNPQYPNTQQPNPTYSPQTQYPDNTNTQIPNSTNTSSNQSPYYYVPQTTNPYYSTTTTNTPTLDKQIYYQITEQMLGFKLNSTTPNVLP
ncbi:hypothetical protein SDC9_21768 [bioreactor metagenome]|uniref:Peptidoglycan binding-like domain-containing protein n=1 Tax=bioreactor metagenome TaxID=1076179 RepID=A0A644UAB0_9ZZZZ|nr:peptidoglycan-binding domain-containing protein [Candidatus Elulimicrobiales bacterium]